MVIQLSYWLKQSIYMIWKDILLIVFIKYVVSNIFLS